MQKSGVEKWRIPFPNTPVGTARAIIVATLAVTEDPAATGEPDSSEVSVDEVQTDLTTGRTEMDTFLSKDNEYKMRVHTIDQDSKRTEIAVNALGNSVGDLEKRNETFRTENLYKEDGRGSCHEVL